jgi:hypothetical protein
MKMLIHLVLIEFLSVRKKVCYMDRARTTIEQKIQRERQRAQLED